jgi:hypothetical protein
VLRAEGSSLRPALQWLLAQGWARGVKEDGDHRMRTLLHAVAAGQKPLAVELSEFQQMIAAINRVLQDA